MEKENEENLRFYPGDIVVLKRMDSPEMLILEKVLIEKEDKKSISFKCGWYNRNQDFVSFIFDARDLIKIKSK